MIPGAFAYEAMLGFLKLTSDLDVATYQALLNQTVKLYLFFLIAGVSLPMLISRKESAKNIHFK